MIKMALLSISPFRITQFICLLIPFGITLYSGSLVVGSPLDQTSLLDELANDDFTTRQRASEKLLVDEQLDQETIKQLYSQSHLPEQRHRLLEVARHHALRQMRLEAMDGQGKGAIGIRHEAFSDTHFPILGRRTGLVVVETFSGFPGHAHLRRGDLILAIDDQRFPAGTISDEVADQFVRSVQEHLPGERVSFTVFRHGRLITVQLRLANLNALRSMYKNAQKLQQPFYDRWELIRKNLVMAPSPSSELNNHMPPRQTPQWIELHQQPTD